MSRPTLEDVFPQRSINRRIRATSIYLLGGLAVGALAALIAAHLDAPGMLLANSAGAPTLAGVALWFFEFEDWARKARHQARAALAADVQAFYGLSVVAEHLPVWPNQAVTVPLADGRRVAAFFPDRNSPLVLSQITEQVPRVAA